MPTASTLRILDVHRLAPAGAARWLISCAVLAMLHFTIAGTAAGQSLVSSATIDSVAPIAPPIISLWDGGTLHAIPARRLSSLSGTTSVFRGEERPPRITFVAVGALIGAVYFTVDAAQDLDSDGIAGKAGGIILLPIAAFGGMMVGGAGGFVVSLVVYPPHLDR